MYHPAVLRGSHLPCKPPNQWFTDHTPAPTVAEGGPGVYPLDPEFPV